MALLTREQLLALASALGHSPVLSVYIDGTATDPSSPQWRTALHHAIESARQAATLDHAGRSDFDRATALLMARLAALDGGLGAPGWAAFIGPREVYYANSAPVAMPTLVVWATGAHIAPYARAMAVTPLAIVALVDARKVEILEYRDGRITRVDEIRAHHTTEQPVHLGAAPSAGFHVGTRGGTGRDRLQRAMREGTARMEREAAEELLRRSGDRDPILVAGTPQHRRKLYKRLAASAGPRVRELESVDIHATAAQIAAAAREACDAIRKARIEREVMAVIEDAGARRSAALGFETTHWALAQGRVQSLLLTPAFLDTKPAEAELAVRSALAQNATVDLALDGIAATLDARGGVAARLRYRLV